MKKAILLLTLFALTLPLFACSGNADKGTGTAGGSNSVQTTLGQPSDGRTEGSKTSETPVTTASKPATTAQKPTTTSNQPETSSEKPSTTAQKPETTSEKPDVTSKKPETSSEKPTTTSKKPEVTSKKPEVTSEKPEVTSEKPNVPDDPTKPPILAESERMKKGKEYSVLFIGSSRSFFNGGVWKAFSEIAGRAGYTVSVDEVTGSGQYLDQLLNPYGVYRPKLDEKLATKHYDFAFIQEISTCPILDYKRFESAATKLYDLFEEKGIQTVIYAVWGNKEGAADLPQMGGSTKGMTDLLAEANNKVGAKLGIPVSHAGLAFYEVYSNHPEIELYNADKGHPSPQGTYLAALCHFVTLTGEDPLNLALGGSSWGLSPEEERILLQAAHDIIYENLK